MFDSFKCCLAISRSSTLSGISRFLDRFFVFSNNDYCGGEIVNSPANVVISIANSRRDLRRRIKQVMVAISGDESSKRWRWLVKLRAISSDVTMSTATAAIWN
ncbi:hypothetical protein TIFTF001_030422 [Ficus carica]|uniref:Uncharacterized protein n=1 Tax=Ficus carica TaxID=3494 RepID=A0AA88J3N9_FICCA|nr:hypothetical protein TIFTF001_030357 [Ficus carica]GMN61330.1 hypothetical protein TIFTF001_030422 [Ficus carica]